MTKNITAAKPKDLEGFEKIIVDLAPVVIFFLANWWFGRDGTTLPFGKKPIIPATAVFTAAFVASMAYSWIKVRHVSPMTLFTGAIVIIFGGLTIWLNNDLFIKLRPTIVNTLLGTLLLGGHLLGRSPVKSLFGQAFPPLKDRGWAIFTYAWVGFFFFSAALNEILRRLLSDDAYVAYISWGDILLTFGFLIVLMPVILKYEEKPVNEPKA
jgi:intracellular septation protein